MNGCFLEIADPSEPLVLVECWFRTLSLSAEILLLALGPNRMTPNHPKWITPKPFPSASFFGGNEAKGPSLSVQERVSWRLQRLHPQSGGSSGQKATNLCWGSALSCGTTEWPVFFYKPTLCPFSFPTIQQAKRASEKKKEKRFHTRDPTTFHTTWKATQRPGSFALTALEGTIVEPTFRGQVP